MSVVLLPAPGVGLLVVVATDVSMTVFNPAEYGGPLTRRQNRLIWAIGRRLTRGRDSPRRHRALAMAAQASTLSLGDLVPSLDWIRIVAPLETLAGLALLTAVIEYIMT